MTFALRAMKAVCPPDHVYKAALYPEKVHLDAYTPQGEWHGHGYVAGGNTLTGYRVDNENGEAVLRFNTVEWVGADIKAMTILIYDATTGFEVNVTHLEKPVGVWGGLFEYKMPAEGVARIA
jgi:hypothetical protein